MKFTETSITFGEKSHQNPISIAEWHRDCLSITASGSGNVSMRI
jgi:hypothetical protein